MLWWTKKTPEPRYWEEGHLSFMGVGFLASHAIGAVIAFKEFAPQITPRKVIGASSGTMVASTLVGNIDLSITIDLAIDLAKHIRKFPLRTLSPQSDLVNAVRKLLDKHVPEDSHKLVNGKLYASLTRFYTVRNEIRCEFESRKELIDVIAASCYVPILSGFLAPKIRGTRYFDGGFTNDWPQLNESTILVSAFVGFGHVCPKSGSYLILPMVCFSNIVRLMHCIFSPTFKKMEQYFLDGYEDAIRFIRENDLHACKRCARLPHRPIRGECEDCETLSKMLYKATPRVSHLEPFWKAQKAEAEMKSANPWRYSLFGETLHLLMAIVLLPFYSMKKLVEEIFGQH